MLKSAEEFRRLRVSTDPAEYRRAGHESAPLEVWLEVIRRYPDLRAWVAHNKTVPVEILAILSDDPDPHVRSFVAMKQKLPEDLQLKLARDPDDGVRDRLVGGRESIAARAQDIGHGWRGTHPRAG